MRNPSQCERDLSHAFGLAMRLDGIPGQLKANLEPLLIEFDLPQEARVNIRNVLANGRHLRETLKALTDHCKSALDAQAILDSGKE